MFHNLSKVVSQSRSGGVYMVMGQDYIPDYFDLVTNQPITEKYFDARSISPAQLKLGTQLY